MTTQATHTPGPWITREIGGDIYIEHQTHDIDVCRVFRPYPIPGETSEDGEITARREANARLIASAPALLAALETIAAGNTDPERMVEIAREAIAQMEGAQ